MAEKVELLNLDINTDKVESDIINLKNRVSELKEEQKKAKETSGELSSEYIKATTNLKVANNQLSSTEKLYVQLTEAQDDNVGTLKKLTAENAKLRKEQESLDLTTEAGIKRSEELNTQINKNTAIIKGNVDQRKQELMNVGNYPGAFGKMKDAVNESVPALGNASNALKRFLANPVVLIIAAIVAVIALLVKAFQRSEDSMNKVRKVTGAISGMFSGLLNILKPVVNFIADKLVVAFEVLGKVADKVMGLLSKGLRSLGYDKAADNLDKFNAKMKESAKLGQELADMEAKYAKAQRETEKIQLDYQKRAEKLRQLRDDESRGIANRIKSNTELGKVLKEQMDAEMVIANQALKISEKRIQLEGESTENLDAIAEAQTKIADINERMTGQESEQLANLNSLRKEAVDAEKARLDEKAAKEKELNDKAIEDARKAAEEKVKLLDYELQVWQINNKEKMSSSEQLTKDLIEGENKRLEEQLNKEKEILNSQLEGKLITQNDYNLALLQLEDDKNTSISELNKQFAEQETQKAKDRIVADYENKKEILADNAFKLLNLEKENLARLKDEELKNAEKIGADKLLIEKKYARAEREIDKAKSEARLSLASGFANNIAKVFGEQSKVGKAAAITATTISTYQAATGAYAAMSPIPYVGPALGIAAAAAAVADGLANVKKILAVDTSMSSAAPSTASASSTSTPSSGAKFSAISASMNADIGAGIVSRTQTNTTDQIAIGVEKGMSNVSLQPTQVIDDVTSKQLEKAKNVKTQNL